MVSFMEVKSHRDEILAIAEKYGVHNIRIFGSVARGQQTSDSDLDLLVTMDSDRSLLDRIGFMQEIRDLLNVKVDVVNEKAIHEIIRGTILNEGVAI